MSRSWSGGYSNAQRRKAEGTHPRFMTTGTVGHLRFVHSDKALDWEAQSGQRGGGKANQDLVIKQPIHTENSLAFILEVIGSHSRAL